MSQPSVALRSWPRAWIWACLAVGCSGDVEEKERDTQAPLPGTECSQVGARTTAADGCNTCVCTDGTWACTLRDCTSGCSERAKPPDDGCNSCACVDGEWACTQRDCNAGCSGPPPDDGCSSCTCADGEWACTERDCDASCSEPAPDDGCNTCSCVDGEWACTRADCTPECTEADNPPPGVCSPCSCVGGEWVCTNVYCPMCPPPRQVEGDIACTQAIVFARDPDSNLCCTYSDRCSVPSGWAAFSSQAACEGQPEPECQAGESMALGCSLCTCTDGAWNCTGNTCPVSVCEPGATRASGDGCNTCTCNDAGTDWACTERACVPNETTPCGARAGDTCGPDEYCAYREGQYCGAADATALCAPRPEACDAQYDPVCGCDNRDYSNACMAALSGTGVLYTGECASRLP